MGYNNLSESTLTAEERAAEKDRIVLLLGRISDELTYKEADFVEQMQESSTVSVKQLFYLRDILGKY